MNKKINGVIMTHKFKTIKKLIGGDIEEAFSFISEASCIDGILEMSIDDKIVFKSYGSDVAYPINRDSVKSYLGCTWSSPFDRESMIMAESWNCEYIVRQGRDVVFVYPKTESKEDNVCFSVIIINDNTLDIAIYNNEKSEDVREYLLDCSKYIEARFKTLEYKAYVDRTLGAILYGILNE